MQHKGVRGVNLQLKNEMTVPDNNFGDHWRWARAIWDSVIKSQTRSSPAVGRGYKIEVGIHD